MLLDFNSHNITIVHILRANVVSEVAVNTWI